MTHTRRFFSGAAAIAVALLALAGCHKHTDSLVIVTATPASELSGLELTVRIGATSQTYSVPLMPAEVSVGLYVPESVTGSQTVYATATGPTSPCYAGSAPLEIMKAGATVEVTVPMTLQPVCPPGTGGTGGTSGTGGTGGNAGSGGTSGSGGTGGGRGGTGGGTGGSGGTPPHVAPDFTACTEMDHGDPGTCAACPAGSDVRVYVAFSPTDPSLVVTGGSDGRVKVWKNTAGTLTAQTVLSGTGNAVVAFSPDGSMLAVGRTGGIDIVSVAGWAFQRTLATIAGFRASGVAFSPDGADVFTVGVPSGSTTGGGLFVHAVGDTQSLVLQAAPKTVSLAVSPVAVSGAVPVAVTDGNGKASIYSWSPTAKTLTGPVSLSVTIDGSIAEAAGFAPTGSVFAAGGDDGLVTLWNFPTASNAPPDGQINLTAYTSSNNMRAIAFTPNYGWVVVGGGSFGSLSAYALANGTKVGRQFDTLYDVTSLAFSPNANVVVAGEANCGCVAVCPQ